MRHGSDFCLCPELRKDAQCLALAYRSRSFAMHIRQPHPVQAAVASGPKRDPPAPEQAVTFGQGDRARQIPDLTCGKSAARPGEASVPA
jgi:hypothetical protein